jgi:hypothetical protein
MLCRGDVTYATALWSLKNDLPRVHPQTSRKLAWVLGVEPRELKKREG